MLQHTQNFIDPNQSPLQEAGSGQHVDRFRFSETQSAPGCQSGKSCKDLQQAIIIETDLASMATDQTPLATQGLGTDPLSAHRAGNEFFRQKGLADNRTSRRKFMGN